MHTVIANRIHEVFTEFLDAPTLQNQERLDAAAGQYRESWIEAKASSTPTTPTRATKARSSTHYDRQLEAHAEVDGIPVKLALQERSGPRIEHPFWVLSWRTKYKKGGSNRRYYSNKDGSYWTLPATTALKLMNQMDQLGGLGDEYLDTRRRPSFKTIVSTELSEPERDRQLMGITGPDEDWGSDPFFVINYDPNASWRKVMIVNSETGDATFRSITTDVSYKPRKLLREDADWWLDNSMMDANVQQTRIFHQELRNHLSGS